MKQMLFTFPLLAVMQTSFAQNKDELLTCRWKMTKIIT